MASLQKRFGGLVKAHRKQLGLTQAQLANRALLSVDMIAKVEGGVVGPRFETIEKLAAGLGVDPAALFSDQVPAPGVDRRALTDLVAYLARLSDADLRWAQELLRLAMKRT